MSAALRLRGPDGSGEYVERESGVGLAHRRLAILDLSEAGAQPMQDGDGRAVISYNGEIYNFRALRAELEDSGVAFRGHSDTEVLLHLYLRHGADMLGRLNGIFAFAVWDRASKELLLARDALGVKPLYVHESAKGLAFASEIKALKEVLGPDSQLDAASLHRYLSFLWCPGPGTPLSAVKKLGPGEAMVVRGGRVARRWWWYRPTAFRSHARLDSAPAVVEGTELALREAVRRQLVSDVPVGAFLSGGIDSSAIVAFANEARPGLRCFTISVIGGQESAEEDDLPYARRVARHLDVPLDVIEVSAETMAADLPYMVSVLDEPLADSAALNVLYISRMASAAGIKVLLSGAGGDDVFTGYRRHAALKASGYYSMLPRQLRRVVADAATYLDQRHPTQRRVAKALKGAALDGDARIATWFQWIAEAELFRLYTHDFRREVGNDTAVAPLLGFIAGLEDSVPPLERMLALEQRFFLADHNLLYTDKMSMAASVETRVPFLDLDLLEYAAKIPPRFKLNGSTLKWPLKKAMEAYLPHDIVHRPKTGFGVPLRRWMRTELKELLDDVLSPRSLRDRGLFDPFAVASLMRRDASGEIDASYVLFSLVCIELWCRGFQVKDTRSISPAA